MGRFAPAAGGRGDVRAGRWSDPIYLPAASAIWLALIRLVVSGELAAHIAGNGARMAAGFAVWP